MPPGTALRSLAAGCCRISTRGRRSFQTARNTDQEETESNFDRKGKRRADQSESYTFPTSYNGSMPDPFKVMGLDRNCSPQEVKQQYYRLALILHPDSSHPSASPANFATLHRAYTLLSSSQARQTYERSGQGWTAGSDTPPPYDHVRADVFFRGRAAAETRRANASDRDSGAWGYWGVDGKWYPFPEANVGKETPREPLFVSGANAWALASVGILFLAWVQYHRWDMVMETRLARAADAHDNASAALASARREAKLYGMERREQIRRRVNESKLLKELEEDNVSSEG
ncbi:hypothetical protein BD324DRAFT_149974 [Kockovaella imperatae]|uniref:J domain-containing protein n=1 Tax=Kockovaella imperatae TaxID=4999 RepID=A0A1Y1U8R7_9TREE|nr:hypothetical protein BD324DRAFT_149974 [Kockovaella imperatae]ORX34431.1 hypothetical protein BD324DRAFT_149974 [Kockovaella imperatae]